MKYDSIRAWLLKLYIVGWFKMVPGISVWARQHTELWQTEARPWVVVHRVVGTGPDAWRQAECFCCLWQLEYPDYNWDFSLLELP